MKQGIRWLLAMALGWAGLATAAPTPAVVAHFDDSVPSEWTWGTVTAQDYVPTPMHKGVKISDAKGPGGATTFWGNATNGFATWSVAFMADFSNIPEDGILWSAGNNKTGTTHNATRLFLVRGTGENKGKLCLITGEDKTLLASDTDVVGSEGFRHVTVTSDATCLRLYVDGTKVAASQEPHTGDKSCVQIARGVNNTTGTGNGKHTAGVDMIVDEFWGYSVTLTSEEVKALADAYAMRTLLFTSPEAVEALRAPLTEENAVYDDFEGDNGYDYDWTYSKTASKVAMPETVWSKQGVLTNASNAKPGKQFLPFVGKDKDATISEWTVSVYGVLSCRDDAGIWGFAQPSNDLGNQFRVNLVRRQGNVLAVTHGVENKSTEWRTLCSAEVEGLDTDSRLYTVVSDGTTVRLLVDGVEVAKETPNAEDLVVHANWQVGVLPGGKPVEYQGVHFSDGMLLDAVALQGRALSDDEIAGLARIFPRVQGVNVAVPEVAYPADWKIKAIPTFARACGADATATSSYRRLRELGVSSNISDWYVGALTGSNVNAGGPGAGDGKPTALFLQGGAAQSLSGATYNPDASFTYKGDTLVEVTAPVKVGYLVGGIASRSNTPVFEGNSLVRVTALPEAYSKGAPIIAGGSADVLNSYQSSFKHTGNAALEVTLGEEVTGTCSATLCGGGYDGWDSSSTFVGKSSVMIDAPNVTFSGSVIAGSGGKAGGKGKLTHTGDTTLTLKSGHFTGSLLPHEATTFSGVSTLAIEGSIDLSQAKVGAFDNLALAGTLTLGEKRLASATLAEPAAAATLGITLTEAEREAGADVMLCKVAFEALPDLLTVSVDNAPEGWAARITPDRRLVYGPVPGNHVWDGGDIAWSDAFVDWKDGDSATFEAPTEGSRTITLGANVAVERVTFKGSNRLEGTGLLVADGVTLEDNATFALPKETERGFTYVRLTLSETQGNAQMGIAEFILTKGGLPQAWPEGTTITTNDVEPSWTDNQDVNALIDSVYGPSTAKPAPINPKDGTQVGYTEPVPYIQINYNKWMEPPQCVAVVALGGKVEADGYTFWSSDVAERMPASWKIEVSDDGETWRLFDARTGVSGAKANAAHDYLARGEARMEATVLTLGEGVTIDLSQGIASLLTDEVRGLGATLILPEGGVSSRVPFLVTPTTGLTFTIKEDTETYYRVVYADGAYCVEPYTLTMPLSATVEKDADWTALPWKDAAGYDVPARFWADETFIPDVVLTFKTARSDVKNAPGRTLGELTISGEAGQLHGVASTPLKMRKLVVKGKVLVQHIQPEAVSVAANANLTVDVGGGSKWTWVCPVSGEGLLLKRGGGHLTLNGEITVPRLIHGWSSGSTLTLGQCYEGVIDFSSSVAQSNNFIYNGSTSTATATGGGKVELPQGVTLTLTESDVERANAVFSGEGTLCLPEGATLSLKEEVYLDASKLAKVDVAGMVTVTVADPSENRTLLKCPSPDSEQAERLNIVGDWYAKKVSSGYETRPLPPPAAGHGLEGEALRAVRLAAARADLVDAFEVKTTGKGTPADTMACFTDLPLEASTKENSVTIRCDFGIAALRAIEDGAALLLKAQLLAGDFAEGTQVEVVSPDVELTGVTSIAPPEGETAEAGVRWFRVPFIEGLKQLTIRATH